MVVIGFLLLPMSHSNAQSSIQPKQEHKRSPQLLRDIYIGGNPERYWLFTDTKQAPPSIISSPSDNPPTWGTMVYQSYRGKGWNLYTLEPDGTESKLNSGKGESVYPALQYNVYQIAYENDGYGNMEILSMLDVGGGIHRLTNNPAYDSFPAWSPDGNWIAFTSDRFGNSDIFVMDGNGGNIAALTNSPAYDSEPTWSPDGRQIAFFSGRTGISAVWIMNSDGTDQHQITPGPTALSPAWSPRGDNIAYAQDSDGDNFYEIWFIDLDPINLRKLEVPSGDHYDFWAPTWSPDGEWLAYISTYWIENQGQW